MAGLVSCPIVLRHLRPILTFVCLNKFVIFRTCGEGKVKVAHFEFSYFVNGVALLIYAIFAVLVCVAR